MKSPRMGEESQADLFVFEHGERDLAAMATATRTMKEFKSRLTRSSSNPELELLESADSSPPEKSTLPRSASFDRAYAKTRERWYTH